MARSTVPSTVFGPTNIEFEVFGTSYEDLAGKIERTLGQLLHGRSPYPRSLIEQCYVSIRPEVITRDGMGAAVISSWVATVEWKGQAR